MNNILITTAISYTNGSPHIGHLYESILSDFYKHLFIISGKNVKLLTGTDEHGKKIEDTATKLNLNTIDLCNKYSNEFRELNDKVKTKYDSFIRTTDKDHIILVQSSLHKVLYDNNIYLGKYQGYYNTREEAFVSELECKQNNYTDTVTGKPYELIEEETYYFKLSDYKEKLIEYVKSINTFDHIKNELLGKLEELKDLSISRTSFNWGIKFPYNDKHIVYVWFDALLNYITGKYRLFGIEDTETYHIIGKDIIWFHTVIYPAILMALGREKEITKNIIVHGFIMDKNGNKMSKSLGNTIEVDYLINKYNLEAIRYYLITNTILGEDISFSEERLVTQYNNELIKSFGNLFQRIFKLLIPIQNEINDKLKNIMLDYLPIKNIINDTIDNKFNIKKYIDYVNDKLAFTNKKISDDKPWEKDTNDKINILTDLLIQLDEIMILLFPVIPDKINELRSYLGLSNIDNKTTQNQFLQINIQNSNVKAFIIIK